MKSERTRNAGRNLVFGSLLKGYQIVVPFFMRTVMIRYMGAGYLGLNGLFTSILHVLNLAELGVGSAMVYSMYRAIAAEDGERIDALMYLYRRYYRLIGLAVLCVGLALVPALPYLVAKDVPPGINVTILYLMNLAATVLSYWLFAYRSSLIQAYQRDDIISKVTIVSNTIQYALQLVAIILFGDYYLYVVILLAGQVLTNVLTALASRRLYPDHMPRGILPKDEVQGINQRIRDLFTSKVGAVVLDSCDPIIISAFLGLEMLAIYQNYYYVITALAALFAVFFRAIVAGIGNSLATESAEKNYNNFLEVSCITLCALGVCISCMLCLYQPFVRISFGEKYLLGYGYVLLYCVFFYVYEFCRMLNVFKDAAGIWHSDRLRPLVVSIVNIALNLVLVRMIGLAGILLSTILSYYFLNLPWLMNNVFTYVFKRDVREYLFEVAKLACGMIAACAVSYVLCARLGSGMKGVAMRLAVSFTCSFCIMYVVARRFSQLDRALSRLFVLVPALRRVMPAVDRLKGFLAIPDDAVWAGLIALTCVVDLKTGLMEQYLPLRLPMYALFMVAVVLYIARWGFKISSPVFGLTSLYIGVSALSTVIHGSWSLSGLAGMILPPLTLGLLIETAQGDRLWFTLKVIAVTFSVMVLIDLVSVLAFPEGMYSGSFYDLYFYLGYKTHRTRVQLPLLGIAAVLSWRKRGRIGWSVYLLYAISLCTSYLSLASMGTASLLVLGVEYLLVLLRELADDDPSPFVKRVCSFISDYRVWAAGIVLTSMLLYVSPLGNALAVLMGAAAGRSSSLSGRTTIWAVALNFFKQHPLIGYGHVNPSVYIAQTGINGATSPHSFYLSVLVNSGVVGAMALTGAYVMLLRQRQPMRRTAGSLIMLPVIASLFLGITSSGNYALLAMPLLAIAWHVMCSEGAVAPELPWPLSLVLESSSADGRLPYNEENKDRIASSEGGDGDHEE